MSEQTSIFQLQTKDENLLEFCKDLYDNPRDDFDVVFITKERHQIKAHRLLLTIACDFFRELFETIEFDEFCIILKDYSFNSVNSLIRFFYTGELHCNQEVLQELISLCTEFNCEQIHVIDELIQNQKIPASSVEIISSSEDYLPQLDFSFNNTTLHITQIPQDNTPKMETDFDDYFENAVQNVETIFFNENNDGQQLANNSASEVLDDLSKDIKEEWLEDDVEDISDIDNISDVERVERIAYRNRDDPEQPLNPEYDEQLKKACEDVLTNGTSFLNASKKYGITRSVVHRHVQKIRQQSNETQPASSNKVENGKESWWDLGNPTWNTSTQENLKKKSKNKIHYKLEGAKNPEFAENLRKACQDVVVNGISFWTAHKKYGITRSVIHRHVQRIKEKQQQTKEHKKKKLLSHSAPSITFPALAMNINQLREEQNRYKLRLQQAINSCKDGNSTKRAANMFGVPQNAIERNLRGFKNLKNLS